MLSAMFPTDAHFCELRCAIFGPEKSPSLIIIIIIIIIVLIVVVAAVVVEEEAVVAAAVVPLPPPQARRRGLVEGLLRRGAVALVLLQLLAGDATFHMCVYIYIYIYIYMYI